MASYTVQIEGSNQQGDVWQALNLPENAEGESAEWVAKATDGNQNIADENYRIVVWEGADADTDGEPAYVLYPES